METMRESNRARTRERKTEWIRESSISKFCTKGNLKWVRQEKIKREQEWAQCNEWKSKRGCVFPTLCRGILRRLGSRPHSRNAHMGENSSQGNETWNIFSNAFLLCCKEDMQPSWSPETLSDSPALKIIFPYISPLVLATQTFLRRLTSIYTFFL